MIRVIEGDCLAILPTLQADSIDAVVTDPPYHLKFMGKTWDGGDIAMRPQTWAEVWRVLKPGGHMLCFGGSRTVHRMTCAIEDAGFEIRDTLMWLYGQGFPKSLDVSKAIDKALGKVGETIAFGSEVKRMIPGADQNGTGSWIKDNGRTYQPGAYQPATPEAAQWEGWGTALKPAHETIILARKPLSEGNVAANVLRHGTGAINVDACRVPFSDAADERESKEKNRHSDFNTGPRENAIFGVDTRARGANGNYDPPGRWPANVLHDGSGEVMAAFAAFGARNGGHYPRAHGVGNISTSGHAGQGALIERHADTGTAARFFYCAKATEADRAKSSHPTVKPSALMRWLVQMVCAPGGTVLDPFCGTGSTLLAADQLRCNAIGIEMDAVYAADAYWKCNPADRLLAMVS